MVQRNTGLLVSTILGLLLGLGLVAVGVAALVGLRFGPAELRPAAVIAFGGLSLSWTVLTVLVAAADSTVDPSRFALLPVQPRALAVGLFAAVLTGIPPVLLTVVALATVVTWSASVAGVLAAAGSAVLGVLLTVLVARVVVGVLARVLAGRRGRAVGAAAISVITLFPAGFGILVSTVLPRASVSTDDLERLAIVVGWTPLGWPWAIPFHVDRGEPGAAAAAAALTVATLGALAMVYERQVARALTSPPRSVGDQRIRGRGLILRWAPLGVLWVVAARRLVMWRRDTRLVTVAVQSLVLPVILVGQSLLTGEAWSARFSLLVLAVLSGLTILNDLAYDGTAWTTHVLADVRGWQDRTGRVIATVLLYVPLLGLLYALLVVLGLVEVDARWPAMVLVALCASLGASCLVGALLPGVAPKPGGNPFAGTTGSGVQGVIGALGAFTVPLVSLVPVAVAAALLPPSALAQGLLLAASLAWGAMLLVGGVVLGGRQLDAYAPEMLDRLRRAEV